MDKQLAEKYKASGYVVKSEEFGEQFAAAISVAIKEAVDKSYNEQLTVIDDAMTTLTESAAALRSR